ncbi:enterochelin esterase [Micromonospora polyrhachis]|uniref:Enterochelin esterase family protein n=1 Tax=Micromonospora polyrhachis TaxID=1282883 RepID=A0A7W7WM04_9ACTN|nr:enterochelin esterase domain-containing protein [Micromonospora polyrhachis]MBB4956315.1 enterochelin esterase family protein [Micromonospora polyrhachis]
MRPTSPVMRPAPPSPPRPPSRRTVSTLASRLTAAGSTAEFWETIGRRTPIVEDAAGGGCRVTFLWRSTEAAAVYVTINRVTHDLDDSRMQRIPGTDVWHATFRLPADWRGSYTVLETDVAGDRALHEHEPRWAMRTIREEGVVDPRNPARTRTHGGSTASVAELDAAPRQAAPADGPSPRMRQLVAPSGRTVWLSPPIGDDGASHPLVIVLDGEVWQASGYAVAATDRLVAAGTIRTPFVAMVETGATSPRRMSDLSIDGTMSDEIALSLLPWLRDQMPVSADPRDVVVTGESLGGLTALKTVFDHPAAVGSALSQSASLWQHDMLGRAATAAPVHLFLTVGAFEGTLLEPHRRLREVLATSPHTVTYREFQGGHDMACWRGFWEDGIADLLGQPRP